MDPPADTCGYSIDVPNTDLGAASCCRSTWKNTERCVWHARDDTKDLQDLLHAQEESGRRLDGAYLKGISIAGALSFQDCVLNGADLSETDLFATDFSGALLIEATFTNANVLEADFSDATLINADLDGVDIQPPTNPDRADPVGVDFSNAFLPRASLRNAYLAEANFHNAFLPRTRFDGTIMPYSDFTDATVHAGSFIDTDLSEADFTGVDLENGCFDSAILTGVEFLSADLRDSDFIGTTCKESDFTGADLRRVDFSESNLQYSDFLNEVKLEGSSFENADLRYVDFVHAEMMAVNMEDVNAFEADFEAANLERSVLNRADLFRATLTATNLYGTVFGNVKIDGETEFGDHYIEERKLNTWRGTADISQENLKRAAWSFRMIERVSRENERPSQARKYYRYRKDIQQELRFRGFRSGQVSEGIDWGKSILSNLVTRHGDSPLRVIISSLVTIAIFGVFYLFLGVDKADISLNGSYPNGLFSVPAVLPQVLEDYSVALFFSLISFATGRGMTTNVSTLPRVIAGFETLVGGIFLALLVFVLGRRATW